MVETRQHDRASGLEELERLSVAFRGPSGVVADDLSGLHAAEVAHGQALIRDLHGFATLLDCLHAFVIQSFGPTWRVPRIEDTPQLCIFLAAFRALRVSYRTFWAGYYFEAAGSLRTVSENVILLGAFAKGGIVDRNALSADNTNARQRATSALLGAGSGLSDSDRDAIKDLHETLGMHLHGSKLVSGTLVIRALDLGERPSVTPYFDLQDASHYCLVATCMAWGMHRVLWTLRDRPNEAEWRQKYDLLDRAFRSSVAAIGRPVTEAFTRWINLHFSLVGG